MTTTILVVSTFCGGSDLSDEVWNHCFVVLQTTSTAQNKWGFLVQLTHAWIVDVRPPGSEAMTLNYFICHEHKIHDGIH